MADPINITHELEVIADSEKSGDFDFDDGYWGDAVRAHIHAALLKVDQIIGFTPSGGGWKDVPDPVVVIGIKSFLGGTIALSGLLPPSTIAGLSEFTDAEDITPEEMEVTE